MSRSPTRGQRAAIRAAINRRGQLGLTQEQLAERAGVAPKTIGNFEGAHAWPRARTMGQIERLGLNWPVGHLREIADDIDYPGDDQQPQQIDTEEKAQIVLAEVLRSIALHEEAAQTKRERDILEQLREVVEGHKPDPNGTYGAPGSGL